MVASSLKYVRSVVRIGQWIDHEAIDEVILDADERQCRRIVLTGTNGTRVLLDEAELTRLYHGDGLVLEDGNIVRVAGRPEPLIEIAAPNASDLARLAWHIGNRHTDVQVMAETLRIRRDHVLEEMLRGLGATLTPLDAPFDPEPGAYSAHGRNGD
jgi:urease accessory protein